MIDRKLYHSPQHVRISRNQCPDCQGNLIVTGGCTMCPGCGYSPCG